MAIPMDSEPPLVVDLDGTLIRSDMLLESMLAALRRAPATALWIPLWLLRGRAVLKRELATRAQVGVEALPYRAEVVALVRNAGREGRRVVLATASDATLARDVAAHVGGFSEVLASDGVRNLKGAAKSQALVNRFGERGFDYVGDSAADAAVWKRARRALVVGGPALLALARASSPEASAVESVPSGGSRWLRALRLHQWPKNLLVAVPLLTAHRWTDPHALATSLAAFFAFCLVASAIYVANDLMDLAADRQHDTKCHRPFASGEIGIAAGLAAIPLLLVAGWTLALATSAGFAWALGAYAVIAIAYSLRLKQLAVVDVMVIGGLYTLRIVGGALAIGVVLSQWLLAFSLFVFLSLALVKRHGELAKHLGRDAPASLLPGRGYRPADAPLVAQLGTASGYLSVLVLALYLNSDTVAILYTRPMWLWALPVLVLYWITRVWLLAWRGALAEDPLSFALHDGVSYLVVALMVLCVLVAT